MIGLSAAMRLAQAGAAVAVLERGETGRESSWAGAGIIDAGSLARNDALARLRRTSVARYPDFIADVQRLSGLDVQFHVCGSLDLITDANQMNSARREAAVAERAGVTGALALLEGEALRTAAPYLARDVGAALRDARTAQVRNPRLMQALRVAAERLGADVRTDCEVTDLCVEGGRVSGVRCAAGRLSAPHVVLAAGAWSSGVGQHVAAFVDVRPVRGQIVLLQAPAPPFASVLMHGKRYLVPRCDGLVLIGSTEEPEAGFDKAATAAGVSSLLSAGLRFVPGLASAQVVQAWGGLRPGSRDGRPYLGIVEALPGLIVATGHFRGGVTLAPVTADVVAQLVQRGSSESDLEAFRPGRATDRHVEHADTGDERPAADKLPA
ncbi:MAG: Glycine oxidase [Phycisphaerae bacterium]|nr:Glycine oxidase [Phycisphaerae bacterium]